MPVWLLIKLIDIEANVGDEAVSKKPSVEARKCLVKAKRSKKTARHVSVAESADQSFTPLIGVSVKNEHIPQR